MSINNTSNLIAKLQSYGFKKTNDIIGEYSKDADLYFRKIDNQKYIVFNHYNKNRKEHLQGFDCWISTYKSENDIGKSNAMQTDEVRLGFQLERDWDLIAQYL